MHMHNFMIILTRNMLILISLVFCLVESKLPTYNRKAVRNADLDNIYKIENQLWDSQQCSRTCCITSCLRHIDCRSFAYDSNTEQCQVFNRDFRGQNVSGNSTDGIMHYDIVDDDCGQFGPFANVPAADCADVQSQGYTCSGVYTITIAGIQKQVWCDLQTDGGQWTVIQRRKDGSVDFDVGWNEYKVGFGVASNEHWIDDCGQFGPFANVPAADCADVQSQGYTCSGVYTITIAGIQKQVWCDLQTDGGQWTVIQRRKDGSVDFDVGWNEYKVGFGVASNEHWIGNDALYSLTSNDIVELLIILERWNGVWVHARYSSFRVNDESDKYRLNISEYNGTAGDSFTSHNGEQFSTKDQDNDSWPGACNPTYHTGGWWFYHCAASALNGWYYDSSIAADNACHWYHIIKQRESLKKVFMMIRKN